MSRSLDELQDITKNVLHSEFKYKLISFQKDAGGVKIAKDETGYSIPIPYKKWRVVALGFTVVTGGVSTENPVVSFGIKYGDLAEDADEFGTLTQDVNGNKEFDALDVWVKDPKALLAVPLALGGAGTPTWGAGGENLGTWFTQTAVLEVVRANDHTLTIVPFMLLEVQIR